MNEDEYHIGDDYISGEDKVVVHNLGKLNWSIFDCISKKHVTDEVIITEEQLSHIRDRHPEAYSDAVKYIKDILTSPDYIIRDKRPNTGLVVKRILRGDDSIILVQRISTSEDKEGYKNSLITSWKITEKRLSNYLRNKEVIYIKD